MSQLSDAEKATICHRMVTELWDGGDLDVVDEFVAEDYVEYINHPPEKVRGREHLSEMIRVMHDPAPTWTRIVEDITVSGDIVLIGYSEIDTAVEEQMLTSGYMIFRFEGERLAEGSDLNDPSAPIQWVIDAHLEAVDCP